MSYFCVMATGTYLQYDCSIPFVGLASCFTVFIIVIAVIAVAVVLDAVVDVIIFEIAFFFYSRFLWPSPCVQAGNLRRGDVIFGFFL